MILYKYFLIYPQILDKDFYHQETLQILRPSAASISIRVTIQQKGLLTITGYIFPGKTITFPQPNFPGFTQTRCKVTEETKSLKEKETKAYRR